MRVAGSGDLGLLSPNVTCSLLAVESPLVEGRCHVRKLLAVLMTLGLAGCGSTTVASTTATSSPATVRTPTTRALSSPPPTTPPPTTQPPTTAAATSPSQTTQAPSTQPPTAVPPTTTQTGPSAYDQIAGFARAAQELDAQLRQAARLINAAGPPWRLPNAGLNASVHAADLHKVSRSIPSGFGGELLRRTVLVYSDLASRRFAMRWFEGEGGPWAASDPLSQSGLRTGLAQGAPAAARFATDLAGLVRVAHSSPPVTPTGPTSRDAADLLLLIQLTNTVNGGCESTGGTVFEQLPPIQWRARGDLSGTVGMIGFTAKVVNGSWQIALNAC